MIRTDLPGSFTDIQATGAVLTSGDDAAAAFTSGATNALVTSQNLHASTNGVVTFDYYAGYVNSGLPVASLPFGLFALWDDLYVDGPATLTHQTVIENGIPVEIVQWNQVRLYSAPSGGRGDFQIKIFGSGSTFVQFLYRDVAFAGGGSSATVGVQWSTGDAAQFSLNTAGSVVDGMVLSVVPVAGLFPRFTSTPTAGAAPLSVQFTDQSFTTAVGGITGWQWDLDGDTTIDATAQHPSWVYTGPGRYHVSLTVTDGTFGSRTETKYFYIDVEGPAVPEIEPNESKAQALANGPFVVDHGDRLTGSTTGTSLVTPGAFSADTWLVQTAALPPGIYLHRLVPTSSNLQHVVTLRSTSVLNPALDGVAQTSSTVSSPPRFVQWYGFGRGEKVYVRVTGTSATTAPYTLTLETTAIAAQPVPGAFEPGNITFDSFGFGTLDNEIHVFDGSLTEMLDYQNDQRLVAPVGRFLLDRPFAAGTYYLAMGQFNIVGTHPTASRLPGAASHYYPGSLGGEGVVSPTVLDFPDAVCTNASGTTGSLSFLVRDSLGASTTVAAAANQRSTIQWFRMEVGPPGCAAGGHPVVTSSPPGLEVAMGASVNLSVAATGAAPLSYQWWYNGVPIPALVGGTAPTLALANLDPSFTGSYVCQVSNACGYANSQPCLLTVHYFGPGISQHPAPQTAHCLGEQVTFAVGAFAWFNGALSYQWYRNGMPVPGATSSTLQFPLTGPADAGQYLCRVTEAAFGFTDSSPAALTVQNDPPVITLNGDSYVQIECHAGTYTELGATATDDCDPNVVVTIGGTVDTHVVGYYSVYYTATDSWGNQTTSYRNVNVVDTVPPTIDVAVATPVLWAPNHHMVNVGLSAMISDACSDPTWGFPYTYVEVYTNEDELAETGDGSGHHSPDAADFPAYWSNPDLGGLRLRSERSAQGQGRIYVVMVYTYDQYWNFGFGVQTVVCPHNRSPAAVVAVQAAAANLVLQMTATDYYWDALNVLSANGYVMTGLEPQIGPHQ